MNSVQCNYTVYESKKYQRLAQTCPGGLLGMSLGTGIGINFKPIVTSCLAPSMRPIVSVVTLLVQQNLL